MMKNLLVSVTIACISSVTTIPVLADSGGALPTSDQHGVAAKLSRGLIGFVAGSLVGTPVVFVRKLPEEVSKGAHGLVGSVVQDNNNKLLLVSAGLLWSPAAMIIAGLEAPGYAMRDAYMSDKTFSAEQFSLGEIDSDKKK